MKLRTARWLFIVALVLAACSGNEPAGSEGITEGYRAIDFALESLDGGKVSLSDYAGNIVLLNFWATWCPPCQAEIPDLEAAYRAHRDEGLVILGVAVQDPEPTAVSFAQSMGMTYPILLDTNGQIYRLYRAPGLPMTLVLDRSGVIVARHVGYMSADALEGYLARVLPSS